MSRKPRVDRSPLRANIPETVFVSLINEQGEKEKGRDEFSWCCSFPGGFGWRGTERRRAKRAAAQCSGSQNSAGAGLASHPNPEVVAKAERRIFHRRI
jgi:hypothetical protein